MAPGRKKGASKAKGKKQLSLGDLVLAKVKGHPFWPAKISQPEDWDKAPDPKRYFVEFFGTEEIAFVSAADIQIFTSEVKNKLAARCQGKTVKSFAQAVKEICAAYEKKKKSSGLGDNAERSTLGCDASSVDRTDDMEVDLNDGMGAIHGEILGESTDTSCSKLKHHSHEQGETYDGDIKPSLSGDVVNKLSPIMSSSRNAKISNSAKLQEVLSTSSLDDPCDEKDEVPNYIKDDLISVKRAGNGAWMNGHKYKMIVSGSKRELDGSNEHGRSGSFAVTSLKCSRSDDHILSDSSDQLTGIAKSKTSADDCSQELLPSACGSDPDPNGKEKAKKLVKTEKGIKDSDGINENKVNLIGKNYGRKRGTQIALGKPKVETSETSRPAKRSKCGYVEDSASKASFPKNAKTDSLSSNFIDEKKSTLHEKREILLALQAQTGKANSGTSIQIGKSNASSKAHKIKSDVSALISKANSDLHAQMVGDKSDFPVSMDKVKASVTGDEAVLPATKRHGRALEVMSGSVLLKPNEVTEKSVVEQKKDLSSSAGKAPTSQPPKRRRAVCLYDDDDEDEERKTPVHGGSSSIGKEPFPVRDASKTAQPNIEGSTGLAHSSSALKEPSSQPCVSYISPSQSEIMKRLDAGEPMRGKLDPNKPSSKDSKPILASPERSPYSLLASELFIERHKSTKPLLKLPSVGSQRKTQPSFGKVSVLVSEGSSAPESHVANQANRPTLSGERLKNAPKGTSRLNDATVLMETITELEAGIGDGSSSLVESKTPDSVMSMKHLIAAAQAKRRQAHSQQFSLGNPDYAILSAKDIQETSPSPSLVQPFLSGTCNAIQADIQGIHHQSNLISPSAHGNQSVPHCQMDNEETEEQDFSSGKRAGGGSLSGGTEAAVARDAFEGMIETLSRTKESIGRATRLAIDCAKYGIANEVVELLIQKLESEPSFHRKVDLFFLVDSITQCSHNQKGIAGASYIPTVQAALPRLLGAAAPHGASAHENRRQCLKVLRLWLERKILPEALLKHHIDDIGVPNDAASAGFSLRRPSRAERAVDDPIREMEGMLVDEYGSNATFQLPGLLPCNVLEDDEEDFPSSLVKEEDDVLSLAEPASALGESETYTIAPNERRHCILEDVDGELEMEDVSGDQRDDKFFLTSDSVELEVCPYFSDGIRGSAVENPLGLQALSDDFPPLPPDSPPLPPPLPPSPPSSLLPPTPKLPLPPPLPPPTLPLELPPPPVAPAGPPPSMAPQVSLPIQPNLKPQSVLPPQSLLQSAPQLSYKPAIPHEYSCTPSGNQIVQVSVNASQGHHMDSIMKTELFPPQSPCFAPSSICNSQEHSGFNSSRQLEYGRNDMYRCPRASEQNPHMQPGNTSLAQRPLHPVLPQPAPSHFSFVNPTIQHHVQHSYPPRYPLPSHPDGVRRFVADDKWRMPLSEFSSSSQHGVWMNSGTTLSGPSFRQEGSIQPPVEGPVSNNMNFQLSSTNTLPPGAAIQGHGVPHMLPLRPDMSALNCWRPS